MYNLYIIYSNSNINDILKSLYSYTNSNFQIGPIRRDFTRNKKTNEYIESNRKIIYIENSLFDILKEQKLNEKTKYDFRIIPYDIRKDNYPPSDSVEHLFFPINKCSLKIITDKLYILSKIKIVDINDFTIKNEGVVIFNDNVAMEDRIKIKIILDDIEDSFHVSWIKINVFNKIK